MRSRVISVPGRPANGICSIMYRITIDYGNYYLLLTLITRDLVQKSSCSSTGWGATVLGRLRGAAIDVLALFRFG